MKPIAKRIARASLTQAVLAAPTIYVKGVRVTNVEELEREIKKLKVEGGKALLKGLAG